MELRNDPRMTYRTMPSWPPIWLERYAEHYSVRSGEIGTLTHVGAVPGNNKCFLYITHVGLPYIGSLMFDDATFCSFIVEVLTASRGKSIIEIGNLDLSHTLLA